MVEALIILVAGLCLGSFFNVVIYRLPQGMSLIRPPSSCPQCQSRIKFYHNIPVVSYVLLNGKCRYCGSKIPLTYLLVEMLTPLSFLWLYVQMGLNWHYFSACVFTSALIILGFIDYYHQIIPDEITLPGIVLALVYSLFRIDLTLRQALVGAVLGAGFLLLVYGTYYLVRKKEGLGMGDVTMMLMIGAYLGWQLTFFTLILASFLGALIGIYFIYVRKKDMQFALPFGTFLAPAAYIALLYGNRIIDAYFNLFRGP